MKAQERGLDMTKRQMARVAFDPEHLRLMRRARHAAPGQREQRRKELVAYVASVLPDRRRRRVRR